MQIRPHVYGVTQYFLSEVDLPCGHADCGGDRWKRRLGLAYAEYLAEHGFDLVLVARNRPCLDAAAERITHRRGVQVEAMVADLVDPQQRGSVERRLAEADRPVHLLVNNAGTECRDVFGSAPMDSLRAEVALNITAVMCLTRAVLPGMMGRGGGGIINVASFAGYLPPGGSSYGASKVWVLSFSDTVAASLSDTDVRVMGVCVGRLTGSASITASTTASTARSPLWLTPQQVVRTSMADLAAGRSRSTPGWLYRAVVAFLESPRTSLRLVAALAGRGHRQRTRRRPTGDSAPVGPADGR